MSRQGGTGESPVALGATGDVQPRIIDSDGLNRLIGELRARGYRVIGPVMRDGAIVLDEVSSVTNLPQGWTDDQDGGRYRLRRRDDAALFGFAVGPSSAKRWLHPPRVLEWRAVRRGDEIEIRGHENHDPPLAFLGLRGCDLAAVAVQDRVLGGECAPDEGYLARRRPAFVVAVHCGSPSGACFCVSMDTGPRARGGYDLALTELLNGRHEFLVEVASESGAEVASHLPSRPAGASDLAAAQAVVDAAAARMGRVLEHPAAVPALLLENLEHPRWDDVASRCLSCGNCTSVCPTCFCTSPEDVTDLAGTTSERWRHWDSCFTLDFSYLHGGSVRATTKARYRQWLTHKLATWWEQFGTSGCVGCGRCVTWCPVGIDLTEEVRAIRATTEGP